RSRPWRCLEALGHRSSHRPARDRTCAPRTARRRARRMPRYTRATRRQPTRRHWDSSSLDGPSYTTLLRSKAAATEHEQLPCHRVRTAAMASRAEATAPSLGEARTYLKEHTRDLGLADLKLPDGSGLERLREADSQVATEIVLITGNATVDSAVEALRSGASDYLTKPVDIPRL